MPDKPSNSRFEQLCQMFANALALQLGYRVKELAGHEGWLLCDLQNAPDILIYKDQRALSRSDNRPPRIVLVPRGGTITPPDRVGPVKDLDPTGAVKIRRIRNFQIQVYCWGENKEQAEDLVHDAIIAFEGSGSGSNGDAVNGAHNAINFDGNEVWEDQQAGAGGDETFGHQISFFAVFAIIVTTKPQPLVRINASHIRSTVTLLDDTEVIVQ